MQIPGIVGYRLSGAISLLALCAANTLLPQEVPNKSAQIQAAQCAARPLHVKLTPEQGRGLRLLKTAKSEAAGLQPDMRAFVLWQISHGYRKIDSVKADAILKDAFRATLSLGNVQQRCTSSEAELCGAKHWVQKQILRDIVAQGRKTDEVRHLLASAEPEVQQVVKPDLLRRYVRDKAFDQAQTLLMEMANEDGYFSYRGAVEVMDALPRTQAHDRLDIFSEALQAYDQHVDEKYPTSDDFATMALHIWHDLPPSFVLLAVDKILDRAKVVDAEQAEQEAATIGISGERGDVSFSSIYQFRLFQLMPILEQLDAPRAESLLHDNGEVKTALGRQAPPLTSGATQLDTGGRHDTFGISTGDTAQAAADEAQYDLSRRQRRILDEAEKDPKQALSDALGLPLGRGSEPEYSPRASTLISIAQIVVTRNPTVSRAALEEIRKIADAMPARSQSEVLSELPGIYLRLGEADEAEASLSELVKLAGKLYSHDNDVNDPNQAFKGMWPSANLWRLCIAVATKVAPNQAEQIMENIPDPEIRTFERITLANSLLGASTSRLSIIEKHKAGLTVSIGL
jgi:hypothetical protein